MQYNELGQEIERILPGNVISQWQYDVTGRPTNHRISSQNRHTRRRVYNWDVNHRLKSMVNELTAGQTTYGYDEFSNLVWSNQGNPFDFIHRNVDDVGNLYETKEKSDRVYGAGSRLLETKDAKLSYDEEGNLVQKVEKNGDTWKYEYNGNGMMLKVIKPDQTEVTFKYDPMGRRIEKSSNEKTTSFIWDGNTILHEYFLENNPVEPENLVMPQNNSEVPANLVTWVFNDGFVPSAKITNEGNYSIISDYLGTPVEAYDEEGKKVWSAELDVYGRVKEFTGELDFIPFRYQGQYEDIEIGLYYNRFRYYDPEQGNYTQIDPIGLAGGNPTLYGYVRDTNKFVDVFGLIAENTPGFHVYGLFDSGAEKPYYIGITNDLDRRANEHRDSKRLSNGSMLRPLDTNVTYGQARGYEQAYIKHYETLTGNRGEPISSTNRGNKINSFDHNNTTRPASRQKYFEDAYQSKMNGLKGGKCK